MSASSASTASVQTLWQVPLAWIFSSIGKKFVVAVTGAAMVLFVIGHLLGNTTIFFGPDAVNSYAMHLRDLGPLLWVARIGLLAAIGLHVFFTMLLWKENQAARPQKYAVSAPMKTTVFARTMRLSGLIVLAFVAFHLAHFTWHWVQPSNAEFHTQLDGREVHNVYAMVVLGFRNPFVSIFYIFSLGLVAFHLSHGIGSLFQTLGLSNSTVRPAYETAAKALAWLLFAGYSAIPISILVFGLGKGIVP
jgi:succinate dehydrogenase / fumarate reductase cytochrome b subunit